MVKQFFLEQVNTFQDVNIKLIDRELKTDLFVKPMDRHQFLDSASCHSHHCSKGISYSHALRLNTICSDNENFERRCNKLEKWFMERGYVKK